MNIEELKKEKEMLLKELDDLNNSITQEDIESASIEDSLKFTKLVLEIRRKLAILDKVV